MPMTTTQETIPVAVAGGGRMGRHHVRTYANLAGAELLAIVEPDEERAETLADEFGCAAVKTVDELLSRFPQIRAVSVAVPTARHPAVAMPLIEAGIACLVEKPLAATSEEARTIMEAAKQNNVAVQVGHTERFNPAVRALSAMNIPARFMEVDRISPMTFRSLDVGVVMDMMIHDLDIVLSLAKSPLVKVDAAGVTVLGEHEDVANARLVFANGCVANLTASRLALKTERKLRIFSETAYVSLNYQKRDGVVIRRAANAEELERVRDQIADGADLSDLDYSELIQLDELKMDMPDGQDDPLTAELSSFLAAVRDGTTPEVDAEAGLAAVEAAERVVEAIRAHQWEGVPAGRVR